MTTEIAVRDEHAAGLPSLADGPNPAAAVAYAAQVSTQIAAVLEEGNGFNTIQGRKHVTIEGWQSLAAMTGHSVEVDWSRPVDGMEPDGRGVRAWEARAVVRDQHGRVVAAGESMADPAELTPKGKPAPWTRGGNYSVRSMAQTRAMSRALSSRMRYIVQLAGFSGTPAEEMGGGDGVAAAPDPIQIARSRFRILTGTEGDGLAQTQDAVMARIGDDPSRLADDGYFAYVAFMLGCDAENRDVQEGEPVEGEVIDGQEAMDVGPEPRREDVA